MNDCKWELLGERLVCSYCAHVYPPDDPANPGSPIFPLPADLREHPENLHGPICHKSPDLQPSAEKLGISPTTIGHYAQALARWTAAGFPTRTQTEVGALVTICESNQCGKYVDGQCAACGCPSNRTGMAAKNKPKMATEDCGVNLWPKNKYTATAAS